MLLNDIYNDELLYYQNSHTWSGVIMRVTTKACVSYSDSPLRQSALTV
jgi:hypothetical protein